MTAHDRSSRGARYFTTFTELTRYIHIQIQMLNRHQLNGCQFFDNFLGDFYNERILTHSPISY